MPVEVSVRFAGTLMSSTVVPLGRTFRLGTAPGVDAEMLGLFSFPLVDTSGHVHLPPGVRATGVDPVRVVAGAMEIEISPVRPVTILPHARLDGRLVPYLVVALLAHLATWAFAMSQPTPAPVPLPRLARLLSPATPAPPPERTGARMRLEDGRVDTRGESRAQGHLGQRQVEEAKMRNSDGGHAAAQYIPEGITAARLHRLIGDTDFGQAFSGMHQAYRPDDDTAGFAAAQRFDPRSRPGFESVKVARYATVAHGRGAGEAYVLAGETSLEVELVATQATGAIDRASVHSWVAPHADDFRACFDGAPSVTVDFTIANGTVHGARGRGRAGSCAAAVLTGIAFPRTDGTTRVRYAITYRT